MPVDPELVTLLSTYRVGFLPPVPGTLVPGELYVEIGDGTAPPQLWVGATAKGVALLASASDPVPASPPVNRDVPYASQNGSTLSCTMGNWEGTPNSYFYQWQIDGSAVGLNSPQYIITTDDIGHVAVCVVTASNTIGTTEGPPSNEVTIAAP